MSLPLSAWESYGPPTSAGYKSAFHTRRGNEPKTKVGTGNGKDILNEFPTVPEMGNGSLGQKLIQAGTGDLVVNSRVCARAGTPSPRNA
eukprot:967578-Amphidinium_carterae.1